MPRANRYILPGYVYHLNHRCHDRSFLLKFAKDRNGYRRRLREAILEFDVSLLTYIVTSNHVHLLAYAVEVESIAGLMQHSAGEFARDYNRRKKRTGAFWEGRYHVTMIDSGDYIWNCLTYIELNMVRAGVVPHPRDWPWSGYGELMGWRRRNGLLDVEKLLWLVRAFSIEDFRQQLNWKLEQAIIGDQLKRAEKWTQSLAVGSQPFVARVAAGLRSRQELEASEEGDHWILRENMDGFSGPKSEP